MSQQPPEKPEKDERKGPDGWLKRLADESTGLPEYQRRAQRENPPEAGNGSESSRLWRLAGVGIQFAGTVALFALVGHWLDGRYGWTPWGMVSLSMVAVVGNTYLLIKEALKLNK